MHSGKYAIPVDISCIGPSIKKLRVIIVIEALKNIKKANSIFTIGFFILCYNQVLLLAAFYSAFDSTQPVLPWLSGEQWFLLNSLL